jgi:diguanylate cyclase (GGDEF)-like protein
MSDLRHAVPAIRGAVADLVHDPRTARGQLALGRALLVTCGLVLVASFQLLELSTQGRWVLLGVSIVMLGVIVFASQLPWRDDGSGLALLFPLSVFAALASIGLADGGQATSGYSGLIVLCFVYVGLTQRALVSSMLAPVAAATWLATQGTWSALVAVRLSLAVIIWLVVGELLSVRSTRAAADQQALAGQANVDSLTGLLSRRRIDDRLDTATCGDAIVMCDLDHFKRLNDEKGHAAGDRALTAFGALLQGALRGEDAAGRYGGEEFVLILADTSPEAALDVLSRMRERWAKVESSVTFSSGISAVTDSCQARQALSSADEALYASKSAGRNCDHINYQHIVMASHPRP